jgi:hypothetical protein
LAKKALINGIEARMKSVAATVVLVIACIKHIPAEARRIPARVPDQPTLVIFLKVFLWYLKRRINRIVSESASPLYRVIWSGAAVSIPLIIKPAKLIIIDPRTIRSMAFIRLLMKSLYLFKLLFANLTGSFPCTSNQ